MPITFISCGPNPGDSHPDEWMLVGLVDTGESQAEAIEEADALDRLMCDCCQGYESSHKELVKSGDNMLCADCAVW